MILQNGSTGEAVKKLQTTLGVTADGSFGNGTATALKEWQTKNGLTPDGVAGDATLAKMGIHIDPPKSVDITLLKGHIPDTIYNQLPTVCTKYEINNVLRMSHFLSQCACESGNFTVFSENLYYSADRLLQIFPRYFKTIDDAKKVAMNPTAIANVVYGSRLGNTQPNDGGAFSGKGAIQLTGRSNYQLFSESVGDKDVMTHPNIVADKYSLVSAAWFFYTKHLNQIADTGNSPEVVKTITQHVNGGQLGYDVRLKYFNSFYGLLS